ncbi:MAG: hypothetical protein LBH24_02185 [Clostridiales bacterium]|nr:hypothetical protein [Clostridiales bacterium]
MLGKGHVVESDLFDIAGRLKGIDEGYFIFRNDRLGRYEVHNKNQRGDTLSLVVPYARLDARTLTLARRTRRERLDKLFAETEAENRRLEKRRVEAAVKNAAAEAERILSPLCAGKEDIKEDIYSNERV